MSAEQDYFESNYRLTVGYAKMQELMEPNEQHIINTLKFPDDRRFTYYDPKYMSPEDVETLPELIQRYVDSGEYESVRVIDSFSANGEPSPSYVSIVGVPKATSTQG